MLRPSGFTAVSLTITLLLMSGVLGAISFQRNAGRPSQPPTGAAIAAAAREAVLDTGNAGTATMFGKPFKFTPIRSRPDHRIDSEKGFVAGVLENGAAGDETGLPPGKYNVFIMRLGGQWKAYLEANGSIVREAVRVTATPGGRNGKPTFSEKGWCVRWFLCGVYFVVIDAGVGCFTWVTCH
jgi:hypothetical protein